MADPSAMKIEIPGVDFTQLAREAIAAKLTEAFVGSDDLIRRIVVAAMEQKVNDQGHVPQRSYEEKLPFVEWLAQDLIRKAVLEVMKTKIESLRPVFEKAVEVELRRSAKASAKVLVGALATSAANPYSFKAEVIIKAVPRER